MYTASRLGLARNFAKSFSELILNSLAKDSDLSSFLPKTDIREALVVFLIEWANALAMDPGPIIPQLTLFMAHFILCYIFEQFGMKRFIDGIKNYHY